MICIRSLLLYQAENHPPSVICVQVRHQAAAVDLAVAAATWQHSLLLRHDGESSRKQRCNQHHSSYYAQHRQHRGGPVCGDRTEVVDKWGHGPSLQGDTGWCGVQDLGFRAFAKQAVILWMLQQLSGYDGLIHQVVHSFLLVCIFNNACCANGLA